MGIISELVRGAIEGVAGAWDKRRGGVPRAELAPTNNFFFADPQAPIRPQQALVPSFLALDSVIPSTLHMEIVSGEDEYLFDIDQPALVLIFSLQTEDEITIGMRLGEELHLDVAPGPYGVLVMAYIDEDLELIDGIGFSVIPVEDWALDVSFAVELHEVDETEADACLEEINEMLLDVFD